MSSQVIQFQCSACQAHLTVPAHLAGVTGPCPKCGQSITSPAASTASTAAIPVPAPSPAPGPAPAWVPPASPATSPLPAVTAPPSSPAASEWGSPAAPTVLPPRQPPPDQPAASLLGGLPLSSPSPPAATPAPPASSLPPARSSLIPGAPELPKLPSLDPTSGSPTAAPTGPDNASLLNSLLTSASTAPAAAEAAPSSPLPSVSAPPPVTLPTAASAPVSVELPRQPLPPFPPKPGRGSNLARFGIAVVLLLACVALLGYVGRQPLNELYARYFASAETPLPEAPDPATTTDSPLAVTPPPPEDPTVPLVEQKDTPPSTTALNPPMPGQLAPGDPLPQPPKMVPSPSGTAKAVDPTAPDAPLTEIKRATPTPATDPASAEPAAPPKPAESLMEVPSATTTSTLQSGEPAVAVPAEAKPAADALLAFLSSSSIDGKRPYILGIDDPQITALVERYYGQADPGAIPVTSISLLRHDPNPEVGGGMQSVFMVASPDWTYPIPVMLQETKKGFKLDWIAFIEFKDNMLLKFVQAYRDNPSRFHVSIKRSHYFERDVPDLENKDCFIIQPPQEDFEVSVFVPKNTPLADKLRRDLSWNTQFAYVLAEIQWRDDGTHQWIELTAVPQLNWYITTETPGVGKASQ